MDNYEIQHGHEEEAQEPLGLFHCIAMDFGCVDESGSLQMLELMGQKCT